MAKRDDYKMWVLTMFDLPTQTPEQRKAANQFRNDLKDFGFVLLQLSVYSLYLPTGARFDCLAKEIIASVPDEGEVRILGITDTQWQNSIYFYNSNEEKPEEPPEQLMIF